MVKISARALAPAQETAARALAETLGLPFAQEAELWLELAEDRLQLREHSGSGPVSVDFVGGPLGFRRLHGGGRGQPLARAVGLKSGRAPSVLDATAGLGRDAFVLATLGCEVQMIERSPIVTALLEDGLRRAAQDPDCAPIAQRMRPICGDAVALMQEMADPFDKLRARNARPEVVYLDPMYPPRQKSALVKKELRLLQILLGHDQDNAALLAAALACARYRVVVKRPKGAEPLPGRLPNGCIASPNTRFDVYSTENSARGI